MKRSLIIVAAIFMAIGVGTASAKGPKAEVMVGADASEWDSGTPGYPVQPDWFPIRGSGQINGNFVIVRLDGVEIGLRATDRKDGLLEVYADGKKGVYRALTGLDQGEEGIAEWNYDWHVDLRGSDSEKTLGDYELTLTQTFAPKLNGKAGPVDLTFPEVTMGLLDNAVLYQSSQNPAFFNDTFDVYAEGTYNLMLKLKPKKGGPSLIARIKVIVSDE